VCVWKTNSQAVWHTNWINTSFTGGDRRYAHNIVIRDNQALFTVYKTIYVRKVKELVVKYLESETLRPKSVRFRRRVRNEKVRDQRKTIRLPMGKTGKRN
jgi:hypothetical protein